MSCHGTFHPLSGHPRLLRSQALRMFCHGCRADSADGFAVRTCHGQNAFRPSALHHSESDALDPRHARFHRRDARRRCGGYVLEVFRRRTRPVCPRETTAHRDPGRRTACDRMSGIGEGVDFPSRLATFRRDQSTRRSAVLVCPGGISDTVILGFGLRK